MAITLGSLSATEGTDFSTTVSGFTAGTKYRLLANNAQGVFQMTDGLDTTETLTASGALLTPGVKRVVVEENGFRTPFDITVAKAGVAVPFTAVAPAATATLTVGDAVSLAAPTVSGGTGPFTYALVDAIGGTRRQPPPGFVFSTSTGALSGTATSRNGLYGVAVEVTDTAGRKVRTGPFSMPVTTPTPSAGVAVLLGFALNGASNVATAAMLARVRFGVGRGRIVVKGDSTSTGEGAAGPGPFYIAGARPFRTASTMAAALTAAGYPALDNGIVGDNGLQIALGQALPVYDTRVGSNMVAGNATGSNWGVSGGAAFAGANYLTNPSGGAALPITVDAVDTFEIVYYNSTAGTLNYTIDNLAPATGPASSTISSGSGFTKATVKAAAVGSHVFRMASASLGLAIRSVTAYDSTKPVIDILVHASLGASSADQAATNGSWQNNEALAFDAPDLTIINCLLNDMNAAGTAGLTGGALTAAINGSVANIARMVTTARLSGDALVAFPHPATGNYNYQVGAYRAAVSAWCAANQVDYLDLWVNFGGVVPASAVDGVHLGAAGYAEIGMVYQRAIVAMAAASAVAEPAAIAWGAASMIGFQTGTIAASSPAAVARKTFTPAKTVANATLQVTALGTYVPYLNGARVGDREMTPGWTDYNVRRQFQTYDVTSRITSGLNAVGVEIGDGWAHGNMSLRGRNYYGADVPRAMVALKLTYADGTSETIVSDGTWKATTSDNTINDIYNGSTHDARLRKDWSNPATSDSAWSAVTTASPGSVPLVKQPSPAARRKETIAPIARTNPSTGVYIFDFGVNHVGYVTLTVAGAAAGAQITLRHAEDLKTDNSGTLYTANLRAAQATDRFICAGTGTEVFEPRHTYHGYRYVEVTGYPGVPPLSALSSNFIYQDAPTLSTFASSSTILKKSWDAAVLAWKGNALSIPTDCPQRDERLGWAADAHLFARSATLVQECAGLLDKFCYDLDDSTVGGNVGDVAPYVADVSRGSAGWGEAAIIIPWTLYTVYGDTKYLTNHWATMKAVLPALPYSNSYNDFLNLGQPTDANVFRYAFAYRAASILKQAADVLGDTTTSTNAANAMASFSSTWNGYVTNGGANITGNAQTAFILGVAFGILPANQRAAAVASLVSLIGSQGLKCGFVGLTYLYDVLADYGNLDLAYAIAEKTTDPSLGFQLNSGLTTTAEQWNPRGLQGNNDGSNSYNHYVRGAVLEWITRTVAGIDAAAPGFASVLLRPRPGGAATSASLTYASPRGPISTAWSISGSDMTWAFTLPVAGIVVLPPSYTSTGLAGTAGVTALSDDAITGGKRYAVPAGSYSITASRPAQVPWTPDKLTGLTNWWDADNVASITQSGGKVSAWTDRKSALGAANATGAQQPAYSATALNGKPGLVFDGVDDRLAFGSNGSIPTGATSTTVLVVAGSTQSADSAAVTWGAVGIGSWVKVGEAGDNGFPAIGDLYLRAGCLGPAPFTNATQIVVFTAPSSGSAAIFSDGTAGASVGPTDKATNGNSGYIGMDLRVQGWWKGGIHEVIVVGNVVSPTDRQRLEGYAAWKWGLQGNLPASHPYKTAAPMTAA